MSHPHGSAAHDAAANEQPYFPRAEWEALRASDASACRAIVVLLLSILTIGLFLYLGVAWWVTR
jgi:hypothetical protein